MSKKTHSAIFFDHIEIVEIKEQKTNWKASLNDMRTALKLGREQDPPDLEELAQRVYREKSEKAKKRMSNFLKVERSIRENGYRTVCENEFEELRAMFSCTEYTTLPRIVDGVIDDGRHRLAALWANGYKEAVVAVCRREERPIEERAEIEQKLHEDITRAAREFAKTDKYRAWKENNVIK